MALPPLAPLDIALEPVHSDFDGAARHAEFAVEGGGSPAGPRAAAPREYASVGTPSAEKFPRAARLVQLAPVACRHLGSARRSERGGLKMSPCAPPGIGVTTRKGPPSASGDFSSSSGRGTRSPASNTRLSRAYSATTEVPVTACARPVLPHHHGRRQATGAFESDHDGLLGAASGQLPATGHARRRAAELVLPQESLEPFRIKAAAAGCRSRRRLTRRIGGGFRAIEDGALGIGIGLPRRPARRDPARRASGPGCAASGVRRAQRLHRAQQDGNALPRLRARALPFSSGTSTPLMASTTLSRQGTDQALGRIPSGRRRR